MSKLKIDSFYSMIKSLFTKKKAVKTEPLESEEVLTGIEKDKLIFQPNTLQSSTAIENPKINNENKNIKIILECNEAAVRHLENLCRFFEITQAEALVTGIWLLTVTKDVEVSGKKLGIITTEQNGIVTEITPINIV